MHHNLFHPSRSIPSFYAVRNNSAYPFLQQWFYFAIFRVAQWLIYNSEIQQALKSQRFFIDSCVGKSWPKLMWLFVFLYKLWMCLLIKCCSKPCWMCHIIYSVCTVLSSVIYKPLKSETQMALRVLDKGLWTCISKNITDWSKEYVQFKF